jgi:RNA polymerase sigma-70 factor (sigma-E family)
MHIEGPCNLAAVCLVGRGMKSSDEQEFTAFVRDRGDALLRYARLLEPDPAAAEDILQIALMRVLRHWPRRLDAPDAYARATILNLVRDRARRRHLVAVPAEAGRDMTGDGPGPIDALIAQERLEGLLGALPPRQRVTVVLRVIEGLSEAETAAAMDCSTGTVKSNLARGLAKLRADLAESTFALKG